MSDDTPAKFEHYRPNLDAWLTSMQEDGNAYLAIEITTDIATLIDRTREHLYSSLGIDPTEITVTIVGSNALHVKHDTFEAPDPFED